MPPKREKKSICQTFSIPRDMLAELEAEAEQRGESLSGCVQRIFALHLRHRNNALSKKEKK